MQNRTIVLMVLFSLNHVSPLFMNLNTELNQSLQYFGFYFYLNTSSKIAFLNKHKHCIVVQLILICFYLKLPRKAFSKLIKSLVSSCYNICFKYHVFPNLLDFIKGRSTNTILLKFVHVY